MRSWKAADQGENPKLENADLKQGNGKNRRETVKSRPRDEKSCSRMFVFKALRRLFSRKESGKTDQSGEFSRENPYLYQLRKLLEQVLEQYQLSYRAFRPLLLDTDTPPESMLDEDETAVVLEQLSEDLNFLRIATNRPAYFSEYIQRMYEDSGLVVQLEEKGAVSLTDVNVILDMEKQGGCSGRYMKEDVLYIPVYKRPWLESETLENLDISIPIGYNTVIVKGR